MSDETTPTTPAEVQPPEETSQEDFLKAAQTLKAEQEKLAQEKAKLEADKKQFVEIMRTAEMSGRAIAGQKEPSKEDKIDEEVKQFFKGTGLNPLG